MNSPNYSNTKRHQYDHRMNLLRYSIGIALYGTNLEQWPRRY